MRLIDADTLTKKLKASVVDADDFEWIKTLIDNAPSIDVVCCGDCKKWTHSDGWTTGECDKWGDITDGADFCSWGERADDE